MKPFGMIIIIFMTAFLTCCKDTVDPPEPADNDRRSQFVGTYKVIDANPSFEYKIEKVDSSDKRTYLKMSNFANLFNFTFYLHQNVSPANSLEFPDIYPMVDKFNNRWDFAVYENSKVPDNCLFHDDTLRVYFRLHNAPWAVYDDTTGSDKYYLQTGVKKH